MQEYIRSRVEQTADALQFGPPTATYQQMFSPAAKRKKYAAPLLVIFVIMGFPSFLLIGSLLSAPRQPTLIMFSTAFFIPFPSAHRTPDLVAKRGCPARYHAHYWEQKDFWSQPISEIPNAFLLLELVRAALLESAQEDERIIE